MKAPPSATAQDVRYNSIFSLPKNILSIVSVRVLAVSKRINGGRHDGIKLNAYFKWRFQG